MVCEFYLNKAVQKLSELYIHYFLQGITDIFSMKTTEI